VSGPAAGAARIAVPAPAGGGSRRGYRWFVLPGLLATLAIIVFPWVFTVWMSFHEWQLGGAASWVGWRNYVELAANQRFREAIWHTFYFSLLAVVLPLALGTAAAVVFHREFPLRGLLRTLFIMPMMATPVAIALIWTMMFHPQLGVLNYLLGLIGIGPSEWVFARATVIPSLALVEIWLWTPFVMIIVLGGLAAIPTEPYESALLDGASAWQMFRHITLPLIMPFLLVAIVIRTIDALKAFDTIYVITQGGPGTASETLNIYLYLNAFSFYNIGYASAVTIVFFVLIVLLSMMLLYLRQKAKWS